MALRHLILVQAALFLIVLVSCTTVPGVQPDDHGPTPVPPPAADRADCGEILGSVFRSESEREWFTANCSTWPQREEVRGLPPVHLQTGAGAATAPAPPTPTAPPRNEPVECGQQRGRAYSSAEQRQWFLANCLGNTPANPQPAPANPPPPQPSASTQGGPDRTDCRAIIGTPYRSNAERDWYRANCSNPR